MVAQRVKHRLLVIVVAFIVLYAVVHIICVAGLLVSEERPRIPHIYLDPSFQSHNMTMGFGFRFQNPEDFIYQDYVFTPSTLDRFSFLSKELGLSYSLSTLTEDSVLPYSFLGTGLLWLTIGFRINLWIY